MWSKIFIASTTAALLSLNISTAIADDNTNQTQPATQTANTQQNDGQIFGILSVLNKNEVAAGKMAQAQTSNPAVKKFAEQMEKDHSKNLEEGMALAKKLSIQPVDSDTSANLQKQGEDEATKLKALTGAQFDQAYADAMVNGHKAALDLLDTQISQASNPKVVEFLKATKKTVAHHLEMAETLSKKVSETKQS